MIALLLLITAIYNYIDDLLFLFLCCFLTILIYYTTVCCYIIHVSYARGTRLTVNPIRSGIFQTAYDPGGGGSKITTTPPPPPTISKTILSIFTISYMCTLLGVSGMFQLEFFNKSRFWPFYRDFKIKSSENSCKKNIFAILIKIDFKYIKNANI